MPLYNVIPWPPEALSDRAPPPRAWWNGIRRLWLVDSAAGPVPLDPQPAPPTHVELHVPPAVKVIL